MAYSNENIEVLAVSDSCGLFKFYLQVVCNGILDDRDGSDLTVNGVFKTVQRNDVAAMGKAVIVSPDVIAAVENTGDNVVLIRVILEDSRFISGSKVPETELCLRVVHWVELLNGPAADIVSCSASLRYEVSESIVAVIRFCIERHKSGAVEVIDIDVYFMSALGIEPDSIVIPAACGACIDRIAA